MTFPGASSAVCARRWRRGHKVREPLTPDERAAIARGPIKKTHRTLSMRGVLRLAREIARDEEMGHRKRRDRKRVRKPKKAC
jgi:hypothetical protein